MRKVTIISQLVGLSLLTFVTGCAQQTADTASESRSDLFAKAEDGPAEKKTDVWSAAISPRPMAFPADHAAHEGYRVEWWYYTGNLESPNGHQLGYQLTFFRTGLHKQPANPSRWAVRDLYTAHFAVSDISGKRHYCFQRNSRHGVGQAGAEADSYDVWNGDWRARLQGDEHVLRAEDGDVAIDLTLTSVKPPVLHGDQGLSQKGATPGNASYYYSLTRMPTEGSVRIGSETYAVRGDSWMDHEFSTSFLEPGQLGWDWLSIQLENDQELMLYRMRRDDGTTDPYSSGSLIDESGVMRHLKVGDYDMTPLEDWTSPETGAVYPLHWRIDMPSLGYQLDIQPAFEAQEMATGETTDISYWEGAIFVAGNGPNGKLEGRGYMELTGYVGEGLGSLFD